MEDSVSSSPWEYGRLSRRTREKAIVTWMIDVMEYVFHLSMVMCRVRCVFFFQAEDGIRDLTVTGVQTCALPISFRHRVLHVINIKHGQFLAPDNMKHPVTKCIEAGNDQIVLTERGYTFGYNDLRSEERRVGEEGRSRWAPDP